MIMMIMISHTYMNHVLHDDDDDDDDHNDDDDDDHNDDDDIYIYIYIMVKCLCVCHKSHYFRIQGIWSFLLFLDTFKHGKCVETGEMTKSLENNDFFKRFSHFSISRHF